MKVAMFGPKRAFALASLLALTGLLLAAGGSAAPTPEASDTSGLVGPVWTPLGLRDGATTVVAQLSGDPVAVVQGAAGRDLNKSEKQAIKSQLKAKQDSLRGAIADLGGTVIADYQFAYNGIKVRIDRSKLGELAQLPGVTGVHALQLMTPDNVRGVPLIGAPAVWDGLAGLHGESIKVAVIDTGIDYTHANFGGPGTVAAYDAANATDTLPANPLLFGPLAPRVKGGIDLVGDAYNAAAPAGSPALTPHMDPNPLDCNGHGSHVAGTVGGSGVLANGSTYTGAYDANTISSNSWTIGPGVAPKVDLYGVRVFGCVGSTDVTVEAIEWAVANDMDVINMSLGSSFGSKDDPSAEASTNAAAAGVVVVASAGNSGASQYITGSPSTGAGAIAVAASDPTQTFPGVNITAGTLTIPGINANEHPSPGVSGNLKVIKDNPATTVNEAEGCSVAAFGGPLPANTIAVVNRGTCARVAKAIFGQQAGAIAVIMANNAAGFPPLEGPITSNPDDGVPYTVTIPFIGVQGSFATATSDGAKLRLVPDGTATTMVPAALTNPGFRAFASFSSGGPRNGDSNLKPDITAPGVSIVSTGNGTGNKAATISGTSMAAPHTAGVAALTVQAHPGWSVEDLKAAILNTGDPSQVVNHRISRGGTGLVQPAKSTKTQVVAKATGDTAAVSISYGFAELLSNFSAARDITLTNHGASAATFNVAAANQTTSSPQSVTLSGSSVTVPAGGTATVSMTLNVVAATVGSSSSGLAFREVAGLITFTPATAADNNGVTLRVPYYLVPRSLSNVDVSLGSTSVQNEVDSVVSTSATVTNAGGARSGNADFYAWGLSDGNEAGDSSADVRAIGIQTFPASDFVGAAAQPNERALVFAINTHTRWSNAATNEFDIYVDVDKDKKADYIVVGVDQGAVQTGTFNGRVGAFVFSTRSAGASIVFLGSDPTNSSTELLPILGRQLCRAGEPCLTPGKDISYQAVSFDLISGAVDPVDGSAKYDAYTPVVGEGAFATVAPGGTANVPFSINVGAFNSTKPLGLMVVALDNASGAAEAKLLPIDLK
jgi:minor extracellular serine protease Vpr